jgi:hypothetical protein
MVLSPFLGLEPCSKPVNPIVSKNATAFTIRPPHLHRCVAGDGPSSLAVDDIDAGAAIEEKRRGPSKALAER